MSKEKGPKKFEDGRQKIDVDYSTDTQSSNSAQRSKKKMSSSILTPVFLLFICIPIAFIVYFWKFYDPSSVGEQAKIDDNQVVEVAKNSVATPPKNNGAAVVEDEEEKHETLSDEEKAAAALAAQEAAEKAAKAEADRVAQKAAEEKAAAEAAAEEERRKAEEEEARKQAAIAAEQARQQAAAEQARKQAAAEAAKKQQQQQQQQQQQKQQEKQQEKQQAVRYHTVQPNETLYRISVNYYGSGDAVDRIKAANGLASNEISVGQTLKLP